MGGRFQPVGQQARWLTVYGLLRDAPAGSVVSYDTLGGALGLDPDKDRHAIQMAMRRAAVEHLECDSRAVDVVPNEGYRVVHAPEQLGIAQRHGRKAGRSLARGHSASANVDLSEVTDPEVRKALELTAQAFALQMDFNRKFAVRQSQLERALANATASQQADRDKAATEFSRLQERVEQLEKERREATL